MIEQRQPKDKWTPSKVRLKPQPSRCYKKGHFRSIDSDLANILIFVMYGCCENVWRKKFPRLAARRLLADFVDLVGC